MKKVREANRGAGKQLSEERNSLQKQLEAAARSKDEKVRWMVENLPSKQVSVEVSKEIEVQIDRANELRRRIESIDSRLQELAAQDATAEHISCGLLKELDKFES